MIAPDAFVRCLKDNGYHDFTGVPCSFFQAAINCVIDDPQTRYTIMPNEGSALAFAAGSYLAGRSTAVMIQNSGFGNLVNPLTSLNMIYKIPTLIFMSGRAYGVKDEPQHEIMGKTMVAVLDAMGVRHEDMPEEEEEFEQSLEKANDWMTSSRQPFVYLVKKDTIDTYSPHRNIANHFPLKRIEAIEILMDQLKGDEYVVATTGKPSRELFTVRDRAKNFYMQGSMGHAVSFALGTALSQPTKKIVLLDGDGALLMHMGVLSAVGHYAPANFYHVVLDNESYETTGDQDTTSPTTDFAAIARACGYRSADTAMDKKSVIEKMTSLMKKEGPALLRIKINRVPTLEIPRISNKYSSGQIADNFRNALAADSGSLKT